MAQGTVTRGRGDGPFVTSALGMDHSGISTATLITRDTFPAGCIACYEGFSYSRLSFRTRTTRSGIPEVVDGFDLSPGGEPFDG